MCIDGLLYGSDIMSRQVLNYFADTDVKLNLDFIQS
jgi:hypothetical protein